MQSNETPSRSLCFTLQGHTKGMFPLMSVLYVKSVWIKGILDSEGCLYVHVAASLLYSSATRTCVSPLYLFLHCMALTHVLSSIFSNNIRKGKKLFDMYKKRADVCKPRTVGCAFEEMRMVYLFEGEIRAQLYYNLYSFMPNKRHGHLHTFMQNC